MDRRIPGCKPGWPFIRVSRRAGNHPGGLLGFFTAWTVFVHPLLSEWRRNWIRKAKRMMTQQLELTFDDSTAFRPRLQRRCPLQLARWWFHRMHRTVAEAMALRERREARLKQQHLTLPPARPASVRFRPQQVEPLAPAA